MCSGGSAWFIIFFLYSIHNCTHDYTCILNITFNINYQGSISCAATSCMSHATRLVQAYGTLFPLVLLVNIWLVGNVDTALDKYMCV